MVEGIVNQPEIYKRVLPKIKTPAASLRGHRLPANAVQSTNKFRSREILAERTTGRISADMLKPNRAPEPCPHLGRLQFLIREIASLIVYK
ncbi:hypothetical protein [Methylobacterium mesophilicum]|uniref:hypothetical protein n=1 Tax=Methylobacterium mesophilicum TaxID=39956 RepID=UPI00361283F5